MNRIQWNYVAALILAALAGLAVGLLLPYAGDGEAGYTDVPGAEQEAVAVFSGQASTENVFSIVPHAQPSPGPGGDGTVQSATTQTFAPVADVTPAPDAAAFSIKPLTGSASKSLGRVLIYHTHTYEAYEQDQLLYEETEKWRTADMDCNMIRVGEELAVLLRGLGYQVEHDTTAFEPPDLSSAYARSLGMLESRKQAGESYDLYIDLHRDAYVEGQAGENTVTAGGVEVARLMLLIGKGEGYTDAGYDQKPDWEANLQVAQGITDALNDQLPGLCKDVRLKSGRFNQHISTGCVLVEVGNNRNTLDQALAAMPYLADAIDAILCP